MTLKDLLSVCEIDNDKLHISTVYNNIVSELSYITEYMVFTDSEVKSVTIKGDELYICIIEEGDN